MSHANPSRDLAAIVERAVDLLLDELRSKRLARSKRPWPETGVPPSRVGKSLATPAKSGRVTRAARREVYERDGLRCTYLSPGGRRCEARAFLELDHAEPRALGGSDNSSNLRVRCRAHNQLWAEEVYGREHIDARRHFRQQRFRGERGEGTARQRVDEAETPLSEILEKVSLALKVMGFRDIEARRAVREVERKRAGTNPLTIEQALREALVAATAASAA